jgi:N-acetyl-gamma-glutamyl-phosphate reductase
VVSRQEAGNAVGAVFPNLRGSKLVFCAPEAAHLTECAAVFFATPHGVAMQQAEALLAAGIRVIDLSADFRLRSAAQFEVEYGKKHIAVSLLEEAVYGLPELNRQRIVGARLVACPGCYPTAVQLGLAPLLRAGLVEIDSLIADCKSGISGAGREARVGLLYGETADSVHAYGVGGHRHHAEIVQELRRIGGGELQLTFVPHLLPMIRGIHATLYARLQRNEDGAVLQACFEEAYADEPFIDVLPPGGQPSTKSVRGSNYCRIAVYRPPRSNLIIVLSVIDNLVKGAAGQAVQCFNLMFGLGETAGLGAIAILP